MINCNYLLTYLFCGVNAEALNILRRLSVSFFGSIFSAISLLVWYKQNHCLIVPMSVKKYNYVFDTGNKQTDRQVSFIKILLIIILLKYITVLTVMLTAC